MRRTNGRLVFRKIPAYMNWKHWQIVYCYSTKWYVRSGMNSESPAFLGYKLIYKGLSAFYYYSPKGETECMFSPQGGHMLEAAPSQKGFIPSP